MPSPIVQLPDAQLRPLLAAYDASVRAKRWHTMLVFACVVVAVALSSCPAEVSPARFFANIGNFTSYIYRLFHLESGALVWTDPVEWYWGLARWLRLLSETLLMAYVGTALGAVGAFFLCFLAAANVSPRPLAAGAGASLLRALPHRAGAGLRADVRDRLRARARSAACWPSPSIRSGRSASCSPRSSRTST